MMLLRTDSYWFIMQVVCEQTGMIKEIEKTFKKLHLVVLRGIMEARDDKIWARFVVEVCFCLKFVLSGNVQSFNITEFSFLYIQGTPGCSSHSSIVVVDAIIRAEMIQMFST
mgnify:FL=1